MMISKINYLGEKIISTNIFIPTLFDLGGVTWKRHGIS